MKAPWPPTQVRLLLLHHSPVCCLPRIHRHRSTAACSSHQSAPPFDAEQHREEFAQYPTRHLGLTRGRRLAHRQASSGRLGVLALSGGPGAQFSEPPSLPRRRRQGVGRCSQLDKAPRNRRFRIDLLTAQAELVDLLDAEAEVSKLYDQYGLWKGEAEKKQQVSDLAVGGILKTLRPDMFAGYKDGKVVYVWDKK
jgi:hypothetical protein